MDMQRAKELLTILADGTDPLTGEVLPDDHVCNKGEIVRALNCAVEALSRKRKKPLPENTGKPWTEELDVPNVVDGPTYGVQQRRAAPGEILLLRHERHLGKGQAVVDDHALIVKQHRGDQGLACLLFLPRDHGVEAADGVRLQSRHRTAAIQNKN